MGKPQVVFTVPLPDGSHVYMKQSISDFECRRVGILIVETAKLITMPGREWLGGSEEVFNAGFKMNYHADQYSKVDGYFSKQGGVNALPFFEVQLAARERVTRNGFLGVGRQVARKRVPTVDWNNGTTRTAWLVRHGCQSFPARWNLDSGLEILDVLDVQPGAAFRLDDLVDRIERFGPVMCS